MSKSLALLLCFAFTFNSWAQTSRPGGRPPGSLAEESKSTPKETEERILKLAAKNAKNCLSSIPKLKSIVEFKNFIEGQKLVDTLKGTHDECSPEEKANRTKCIIDKSMKIEITDLVTHPEVVVHLSKKGLSKA
jgi:hypothetical protein